MNYLTVEQVLFLHARLIAETGGSHGVRDVGLLESAVARPQATFRDKDLYPDLFSKAAALMHSIIHNHPFIDGNKRTGIAAAALFLRRNGWRLKASNAELEAFTLRVADSKTDIPQIALWLEEHSRLEQQPLRRRGATLRTEDCVADALCPIQSGDGGQPLRKLITNGTLITFGEKKEVIPDGALLIEGDRIADMGLTAELAAKYPDEEVLDAEGKLVMPGLICAHTHFYGAFAKGMALPGEQPKNFPEILENLWWRLDKALGYDDIRYSALVCLAEAIRHGTVTLIDHHASPNAIEGSLDVIAQAVEEAGVRACLCYEVTDRDGKEKARAGIRENERFVKGGGGLISGTFGLHASLTLSDETLEECTAVAEELGVGFHIHVAEGMADVEDSIEKSGLRVVGRLEKLGILEERTIAAHCVHVNQHEMEILRETGTKVVHSPRSNMNNAVGTADVPGMLERGLTVGLGNDGFSNNMFTEMHVVYLVHKLAQRDLRTMGADQVLQMAFQNNAQIARLFWTERPLGELSIGAYADLILVDYHPTTPLTQANLPWHIVFGVDGTQVDTTIVGGRVLMRNRELLTLDEEEICARARKLAEELWGRV